MEDKKPKRETQWWLPLKGKHLWDPQQRGKESLGSWPGPKVQENRKRPPVMACGLLIASWGGGNHIALGEASPNTWNTLLNAQYLLPVSILNFIFEIWKIKSVPNIFTHSNSFTPNEV